MCKLMKRIVILFILVWIALPTFLFAEIPGNYELIVPHVPPAARSLDKVIIVEVFAFDCVHCYHFNRDLYPKLKKKFGDKLVLDAKPIGWRGHDPGRLYFIAKNENKGHEVMLTIFELIFEGGLREQMFSRDKLQFVARRHGLFEAFKTQMDSPRIVRQMNQSIQYAKSRNINSTPTLVIEDAIMPVRTYSNLVTIINALLKEPVE